MSRGLGKVQIGVLEALRASSLLLLWSDEIAQSVYGDAPTRAQQEAVRRAIHGLAKRGLVKYHRAGDPFRTGTRLWCALLSVAPLAQSDERHNT